VYCHLFIYYGAVPIAHHIADQ